MHSVNAPDDEANRLYVEQSCLAARLLEQESERTELVIWDVGLGAAFNAMAAIHCFESSLAKPGALVRRLRLISFERDFDPLLLALRYPSRFPHLRHGAPCHILERGQWKHASNLLEWELLKGDFKDFIESAKASRRSSFTTRSPTKPTPRFGRWRPFRGFSIIAWTKPAELYTYSAATGVEGRSLGSGLFCRARHRHRA